ncbi:hypothetical protein PG997_011941 [Apiospora hydei]|uniref:Ankyrin repeat protein n=1 Tax=Apiospora hydei TaxID=1337664 RepID=A0ABR1V570_9PEZI
MKNLDFSKWLLSQGVSVHHRVKDWSTLEQLVCTASNPNKLAVGEIVHERKAFDLLLSHAERSRMNDAGTDGLALIHIIETPGNEWMVDPLVRQGADPNLPTKDDTETPALVHHLVKRNFGYASALLSNGADPSKACRRGWNAVLAASATGATQCLEEIYCAEDVEKRIDWASTCIAHFNRLTRRGMNGLHLAASGGHVVILRFYIKHGLLQDLDSANETGLRPLHLAAIGGHLDVVEYLLSQGCDINAKGDDGRTALHLAAKYGYFEIAKYLIQSGCKPSLDADGWSPLFYAHQADNVELVEYLESQGPGPVCDTQQAKLTVGTTSMLQVRAFAKAFEDAVGQGNLTLCRELHSNGCDLDTFLPSCGGCSPLIKAITDRRLGIVEWLLDQNASILKTACHFQDSPTALHLFIKGPAAKRLLPKALYLYMKQGGTFLGESPPLISAALYNRNVEALSILLDHLKQNKYHYAKLNNINVEDFLSMAVNEQDRRGVTPIRYASVHLGDLDAIDMLLDMGANINARDDRSETPLLATIQYNTANKLKVAAHLVAKGACIERRGRSNFTPLMAACFQGLPDLVEELLDAKADTAVMDQNCASLLHISTSGPSDPRNFVTLVQKGLDIHSLNFDGWSALNLAAFQPSFTPLLLNMDIRLEDSNPIQWTEINISVLSRFHVFMKLARRKYGLEASKRFINLSPGNAWSPLCLAAINGSIAVMDSLLSLGAPLDGDGCPSGSALMAAGEVGQEESVIFLTRRGSALAYSGSSGFRSVYIAAQMFPDLLS